MSNNSTKQIGDAGETFAADFFVRAGYSILERNYRIRTGEIDIVARSPDGTVVFVEVRSRKNRAHGAGMETINVRKKRRLFQAALHYLTYRIGVETDYRFDYASIDNGQVAHFENVDFSDVAGEYR